VPGLDELTGTTYGPFSVVATRERADAFAAAIGDAADDDVLHPMFANVALFSAAPAFLDDEQVRPFTRSLIHSEQTFEWHAPAAIGAVLDVTGTVESVRARGALNFVTFSLSATADGSPWLSGRSVFLMSQEAAAESEDGGEPDEDERPEADDHGVSLALPPAGSDIASLRHGASRTDLMRYAAASGDWNPIHFDHDAARSAGLEGVIVHGLLMAAWVARSARRYGSLTAMKLRFRNPLRPAVGAIASGTVSAVTDDGADLEVVLVAGDTRLVSARVSVTR